MILTNRFTIYTETKESAFCPSETEKSTIEAVVEAFITEKRYSENRSECTQHSCIEVFARWQKFAGRMPERQKLTQFDSPTLSSCHNEGSQKFSSPVNSASDGDLPG